MISFHKYLMCIAVLGMALFLGACSKDDQPIEGGKTQVGPEAIGTYTFDGKEYAVVYGVYARADRYYEFLFSPRNGHGGDAVDIYLMFRIKESWSDGEIYRFEDLYHNDDYLVVYEDPDRYYSRYRKVTGSLSVLSAGDDKFSIHLNMKFIDGKELSFDFEGKLKGTLTPDDVD